MFADLLFPLAAPGRFTYQVPAALQERVGVGSRVLAPLGRGKKMQEGLVVALHTETSESVKEISDVVEETSVVLPQQLQFWAWMAKYYMCQEGEVLKAALPAFKESRRARKESTVCAAKTAPLSPLSAQQARALQEIHAQFQQHAVCLLHGVTSSGKTEVYTYLIKEAFERGEQVLYLLPEIALTTQITSRLRRLFGDAMAVYHSKCTDLERTALWRKQLAADTCVPLVLGARSALFLPFQRLGLVIVDEEHEPSFKQQDPAPRYHARDAAIWLAHAYGARTLLGTATPSLETYRNVKAGKYGLVEMKERFAGIQLPEIVVENVAELRRKRRMHYALSPRLIQEIGDALQKGKQAILFQNRRGYAPVLRCHDCAWTPKCTRCDVTLTFHQGQQRLMCHYCGASYDVPKTCPSCASENLRDVGYGTEKVLEETQQLFPQARIARMDLDTTRSRTAYEQMILQFQRGETDILVGTQMVTKGLDFEGVHVVGILSADQMMCVPDFRAHERAFQMMMQVAGRAGRKGEQGLVVLQTSEPEAPVIRQVLGADFYAMYQSQMQEREEFRFAPHVRMIYLFLKHRDEGVVEAAARQAGDLLRPFFHDDLLGPERPAVARVSLQHIRQLILKIDPRWSLASVHATLYSVRTAVLSRPGQSNVNFYFDVDPL